mgnify:CR=1 FL=1
MARRRQLRLLGPLIFNRWRVPLMSRGPWFDPLLPLALSGWEVFIRTPLTSTPRTTVNPLYHMWLEATGSAALPVNGRNDRPGEVSDGA